LSFVSTNNPSLQLSSLTVADSDRCALHDGQASPNGGWLALQISCEDGGYVQIVSAQAGQMTGEAAWQNAESWFAGWAFDSTALIVTDNFVTTRAFRFDPLQPTHHEIPVPEGTYGLSVSAECC
jgi:hypothetical protein